MEFVTADPGVGARWLLVLDLAHDGPPTTAYDAAAKLLESRAADVGGLFEAMSLGRTATREKGGPFAVSECADLESAIERVTVEVGDTYPGFALRGLDWQSICGRHVGDVRSADDALPALQRWLDELEDGHTWVWPSFGNLPYAARVHADGVTFARVREGTAGYAAGARGGWELAAIDDAEVDAAGWLERAAAPPHSRALIAGRRLLAGPVGVARALTARSPGGESVTWSEAPTGTPDDPLVTWSGLDERTGYARIAAWVAERGVDEAVAAALSELRGRETLILDLRGNPGGNLVLAAHTRDRFLRGRTVLGAIRYSVGGGGLSEPLPLIGEPAEKARGRWDGRLVALTDPLTFSSSEDFLLGLQGLEHVRVVGSATGGGSGRARSLRLLPGTTLTVSTALTYDRAGRCVEGAGIPVDVEATGTDDEVLAVARASDVRRSRRGADGRRHGRVVGHRARLRHPSRPSRLEGLRRRPLAGGPRRAPRRRRRAARARRHRHGADRRGGRRRRPGSSRPGRQRRHRDRSSA